MNIISNKYSNTSYKTILTRYASRATYRFEIGDFRRCKRWHLWTKRAHSRERAQRNIRKVTVTCIIRRTNVTSTADVVSSFPRFAKRDIYARIISRLGHNFSEIIFATLTLGIIGVNWRRPLLLLASHSVRTWLLDGTTTRGTSFEVWNKIGRRRDCCQLKLIVEESRYDVNDFRWCYTKYVLRIGRSYVIL